MGIWSLSVKGQHQILTAIDHILTDNDFVDGYMTGTPLM